jgi:hypothetical protein
MITSLSFLSFPLYCLYLELRLLVTNGKERKDKEVMRSRHSKYRQYNGKERKDKEVMRSRHSKYRQYNGKERKDKEVIRSRNSKYRQRITASDYRFGLFSLFHCIVCT